MRFGLDDKTPPAHGIALRDQVFLLARAGFAIAENQAAGGEIRPLDELHQLFDADLVGSCVMVNQVDQGITDLAQVVRRHVGGHAHGNAAGAVDEQVGQQGRQDRRFAQRLIEVGAKLNRIFVNVIQHAGGNARQASFGIAHGGGVVAVYGAEVALTIHQHVAQRKVLRHAHHGFVHRGIAMRMVLAQHFTDDARALFVRLVGSQAHVVHGIENAPMHRLEAVAHVGQRPRDDHAHRVIQISRLHFLVNINRSNGADSHMLFHGCVF